MDAADIHPLEDPRNFPEGSAKRLLRHPANVRDVVALVAQELADQIDFERLETRDTTFIGEDDRGERADVLVVAPLRTAGRHADRLWIYLAIEHQSEPDPLMPYRMLAYVTEVFHRQYRAWLRQARKRARKRKARPRRLRRGERVFHPVVPIVLYGGPRRWQGVGRLADLIKGGERFAALTPALAPLFVNLPTIPEEVLDRHGGAMGWALRLLQVRKARPAVFQRVLARAAARFDALRPTDHPRWEELLHDLEALIDTVRKPEEDEELHRIIEAHTRDEETREEIARMKKTIAEARREEGRLETGRRTLIRLLERRFGELPPATSAVIEATADLDRLDAWLDQVVTAATLEEVGIER